MMESTLAFAEMVLSYSLNKRKNGLAEDFACSTKKGDHMVVVTVLP